MPRPVSNPPNPWAKAHVEWLDEPPPATLSVFEEEARSMLSENESPDLSFRFSINPYRGCMHACAYCYARPTHQHLGWGAGTDFDRKIVVKTNAPEVLRRELERPSWRGDLVAVSGNTDCYQPLEASYELTRRCLEVLLDFRNPVSVITKNALVRRDTALLAELAAKARAVVTLSIPFASDDLAHRIEPWASKPARRFEAMRALADAGVPVGLAIAPVIPGLNDTDIPELLARAKEAGAERAFLLPLRLPREVLPVFRERLDAAVAPERARKVWNAVVELRGGKTNEAAFGARFEGRGERWKATEALFEAHCRRLGLRTGEASGGEPKPTTFRRPTRQKSLFDDL